MPKCDLFNHGWEEGALSHPGGRFTSLPSYLSLTQLGRRWTSTPWRKAYYFHVPILWCDLFKYLWAEGVLPFPGGRFTSMLSQASSNMFRRKVPCHSLVEGLLPCLPIKWQHIQTVFAGRKIYFHILAEDLFLWRAWHVSKYHFCEEGVLPFLGGCKHSMP